MRSKKWVNEIAYRAVGCAISVHKEMGPGLLEDIYEECLMEELKDAGLMVARQLRFPVPFKKKILKKRLRIDLLVEDSVIIECKSVSAILPIHQAQLLTYLKLTKKPKGLLINFNCVNIINDGLIPIVTDLFAKLPDE